MTHRDVVISTRTPDGPRRRDVVRLTLPSLPERYALLRAHRRALGYTEVDDEAADAGAGPSGDASPEDLAAVLYAALGLAALRPGSGLSVAGVPSFRDLRRDVVAYGEAVVTTLHDAGVDDLRELRDAGDAALELVVASLVAHLDAVEREVEGFEPARTPTDASGPR